MDDDNYDFNITGNEKEKLKIYPIIYKKTFEGIRQYGIICNELPELQKDDLIRIEEEEPFYSDVESWDAHTTVTIRRPRLETDEERDLRLKQYKDILKEAKERRYQTYLKLKEEFENEKA